MSKYFKILNISIIAVFIGLLGCRQDHKKVVEPDTSTDSCETSNVTFTDIKPIFTRNCGGCHDELGTEADAKAWGNFPSIVGAVKHDPANVPMPMGGSKLSDCEIKKIEAWYLKVK